MNQSTAFGKRKEPHTIIIARGQDIRHFVIRPWVVALCGALVMAISVGYLLATTYLVMRDDLLSTAVSRQARLQHAYEDRISGLRAQVDRITSHRLLDQQFMEGKIAELASRQAVIAERSGIMAPLMEKARANGLAPTGAPAATEVPIPALRPGKEPLQKAASLLGLKGTDPMTTGGVYKDLEDIGPMGQLAQVKNELHGIEAAQLSQIAALTDSAYRQKEKLIETARSAGIPIAAGDDGQTGTGGPFIPADSSGMSAAFTESLNDFNEAVETLAKTRSAVRSFPIAHPAPGRSISSTFGNRRDPLIKKTAFHAGIDFRTPMGTPIKASASGKVIRAGRAGGYGNLVEIEHPSGLTTRYAHMSKITVGVGQKVKAGETIGAAGSTGRSTGPHLHYEVRSGGKAINPLTYLKAGAKLKSLL